MKHFSAGLVIRLSKITTLPGAEQKRTTSRSSISKSLR